jgi:hypothetical protein
VIEITRLHLAFRLFHDAAHLVGPGDPLPGDVAVDSARVVEPKLPRSDSQGPILGGDEVSERHKAKVAIILANRQGQFGP